MVTRPVQGTFVLCSDPSGRGPQGISGAHRFNEDGVTMGCRSHGGKAHKFYKSPYVWDVDAGSQTASVAPQELPAETQHL